MKYKVSLLPERNRKRIIGKKKAEKGRSITNVVMLILLASLLITVIGKVYADSKLSEIQTKNAEYEQKVAALHQYREINNTLQTKLELIEKIQIEEPSLYNFVASLGNIDNPGVSVTNLTCADWKTSRICTLTGTALSREAFMTFLEAIQKMNGVKSADCTSYTVSVVGGEAQAQFSISIACEGGVAIVVPSTEPVTAETTVVSADVGVE